MGKDKLALPQNGATVLSAAIDRFSEKFGKVSLSVDSLSRYPEINIHKIEDIYKNCGPLGGLHAALKATECDGVFLAASDLPFSSPDTALKIIELCKDHPICITKDAGGRFEPLFGFYKKCVLETAEELLESGTYKMIALYEKHPPLIVTPEDLGPVYSARSFENMNFPEDFERLLGK